MTSVELEETSEARAADANAAATHHPVENAFAAEPWRHLSQDNITRFYEQHMVSSTDAASTIAEALGLAEYKSDVRQSVRVGFAMQVLLFAKDTHFSPVKSAVLFNISLTILQTAIDGMTLDAAKQVLKDCLIPLTKAGSTSDDASFLAVEVGAITEFFAQGFYQHFKLYTFVFNNDQAVEDEHITLPVERPHIQPFDGLVFTEEEWDTRNQQLEERQRAEQVAEEERRKQEQEAEAAAAKEQAKKEAEFQRELELIRKPANLDEAIEKAVKWRVEKEKRLLDEHYKAEIADLRAQLTATSTPSKK